MAGALPQLEVYYIEFSDKAAVNKSALTTGAKFVSSAALMLLPGAGLLRMARLPMMITGASLTPDAIKALKRVVDENRFFIIKSPEELAEFENAGSRWIVNEKSLKQKQYYIRHPKEMNRKLLIEAQAFHDYIEEEQKAELINFIMSHCPAKRVQIDRTEAVEMGGSAKATGKGTDLSGSVSAGQTKGNYYSITLPSGPPEVAPRENYFWIDESVMLSIAALSEGATFSQTYQSDFTFGLSLSEAKTIGLDLSKRKKYLFTIQIEC